jgi:hypothetical protein
MWFLNTSSPIGYSRNPAGFGVVVAGAGTGGSVVDDRGRVGVRFKFSTRISATPPTIRIVTSGPAQRLSTLVPPAFPDPSA